MFNTNFLNDLFMIKISVFLFTFIFIINKIVLYGKKRNIKIWGDTIPKRSFR